MATHSSILAWKIPRTEEPSRLQSIGSQRVGHAWSELTCTHTHTHTHILVILNRTPLLGSGNLYFYGGPQCSLYTSLFDNSYRQLSALDSSRSLWSCYFFTQSHSDNKYVPNLYWVSYLALFSYLSRYPAVLLIIQILIFSIRRRIPNQSFQQWCFTWASDSYLKIPVGSPYLAP